MSSDKPRFREKFKYWFDNFMAGGPTSMFKLLFIFFIIAFLFTYLLTLVIGLATKGFDPVESIWGVFFQLADTGSMVSQGKDNLAVPLRLTAILTGFVGIVIFSMLIAFITTQVDQKVELLKRGRSKVLEKDHTLILGWNDRILEIIREVILANENQKRGVIVVMSSREKVEMEDTINASISNFMTTKVICRSGEVISFNDLDMVSVNTCKSVILLSEEQAGQTDRTLLDSKVINCVLAICRREDRRQEPFHVIAELQTPLNRPVVASIGGDEVEVIVSPQLIPSITVQATRETGLSVVLMELLSFDGNEIYFLKFPAVAGKTFGALATSIPDIIPIGYNRGGEMRLNPPPEDRLEAQDELIYIAEDDFDLHLAEGLHQRRELGEVAPPQEEERSPEKNLILGWNQNVLGFINELADYVGPGSVVKVIVPAALGKDDAEELALIQGKLENLEIICEVRNYRNPELLEALRPFDYDTISVLSHEEPGLTMEKIEANTIYTILVLRGLRERTPGADKVKIISEILDPAHRKLIEIAQVNDFIVSSHLISKVIAQISEEKGIAELYEQLFTEAGPEFHIKGVSKYVKELPGKYSFYDLALQCQKRGEILIGFKEKKYESVLAKNYGVTVNPVKKAEAVDFAPDDELIVLSKDEG